MITTVCKLSYSSRTVPPIVQAVQGDTGRTVRFDVTDFTIPAGAEATYFIEKPSGEAVYNAATISGNSILCELTAQSLAEPGENKMQVRVILNDEIVTSFKVCLLVSTFWGIDAIESSTEMNIFDQAVEQATEQFQENAEQIVAEVIESIPADYTELTEEVDELNERMLTNVSSEIQWIRGTILASTGVTVADTTRLLTSNFLPLCSCSVSGSGKISPNVFDENFTLLGNLGGWLQSASVADIIEQYPNAKYVKIIFKRDDGSDVSLSDVTNYGINVNITASEADSIKQFERLGIKIYNSFEKGGLTGEGLNNNNEPYINTRCRTSGWIPVKQGKRYDITCICPNNVNYSISFYPSFWLNEMRTWNTNWKHGTIGLESVSDGYIRITFMKSNDSNISPTEISYLIIKEKIQAPVDYLIDSSLMKKGVCLERLGVLSALQAFCKAGDYYYSTEGTTIYKQDETFTLLDSKAINLGHGNSLQLGASGNAFASGWNDQKVYEVDLSTLEVISTINLPTTGYTTCAIDDVNKIAYIFQRDTYPTTNEQYNFIVYDYDNEQIISTKKTIISFGAMQACDFYNDRIIMLYGLGSTATPNGCKVFDVNGNILADYYFGNYATIEPEGVCIDRETGDMLISFVDKTVYKLNVIGN